MMQDPRRAPPTLAGLLAAGRRRLAEAGIEDAALDARLIVEHFSGTTRADAIARPDQPVPATAAAAVEDALKRRLAGEPVHRILGFREFYGLRLALSKETLEPRPDTETLVDAVLPFVRATVARAGDCRILDMGTGTGAVALALLSAVPQATATGVDISDDALATALRNARDLGLADRFSARKSDWFAEIFGRYHVIVSNPPYIPADDIGILQREVRDHDPVRALDGGADGLDAYRGIAAAAAMHLEVGGIVALEIGSTQGAQVTRIFAARGFALSESLRDLGGNERALVFRAAE